jgi:ubiquinone/menaquinone biosynthesis C-methylase UbiE
MKCFDSHLYMGDHPGLAPPLEPLGASDVLHYLKRERLEGALLIPYGSEPCLDSFEQIRLARRRAPNRVFPVARLPASADKRPEARMRLLQQLDAEYTNDSLYGLKIHMAFERPHPEVLAWCDARRLPTIWHLRNAEDFRYLEQDVLPNYSLPIVLAHLGGYPADRARYERAIRLLRSCPQVYLDISCVLFHHYLGKAIAAAPERVLFGSDGPAVPPNAARAVLEAVPLGYCVRRRVYHANARELIRIVKAKRQQLVSSGAQANYPIPVSPAELKRLGFLIKPPSDFPDDEEEKAKAFWAGYSVKEWYRQYQPWVDVLLEYMAALRPERVMEFGCNVGRNLYYLREAFPEVQFTGVDINAAAIEKGRAELGLDLQVANEDIFEHLAADSLDLIYTVSVLDHMPRIDRVARGMLRCARRHVLCLEVSLPVEGKVLRHFDHSKQQTRESTGYSYSWDCRQALQSAGASWTDVRSIYMHPASLGPYYKAFLAHKAPIIRS